MPTPIARVSESLPFDQDLPLVLQPAGRIDLLEWVRREQAELEEKCARHGALLFRGFGLNTAAELERLASVFSPQLIADNGEHEPISPGSRIATPVFYAPERKLLWHNENSFNHEWPRMIWFACVRRAQSGGETPLVDSRRVFAAIDPAVRQAFCQKQVMYVRNYGSGLGLDWRQVFGSSDPREVERRCGRERVDYRWRAEGSLETRAVRPAIARTLSGTVSWFNQAQHWHPACLDPRTRSSLAALFTVDELPRNCYYGDGSQIGDDVMEHILEVYRRLEVVFPWQTGDVLMLDNTAVAHARNPYVGERRHLVALGRSTSFDDPAVRVESLRSGSFRGSQAS